MHNHRKAPIRATICKTVLLYFLNLTHWSKGNISPWVICFPGLTRQQQDIAVAHAPQPGKQSVLDYRWLYGIAQRHNVEWRPRTTADQVLITRASQVVTIDEIRDYVEVALTDHGIQPPFTVDLSSDNFQIHLPVDTPKNINISALEINSRTQRFVASVTTGAQTAQQRTYRISGKYYPLTKCAGSG